MRLFYKPEVVPITDEEAAYDRRKESNPTETLKPLRNVRDRLYVLVGQASEEKISLGVSMLNGMGAAAFPSCETYIPTVIADHKITDEVNELFGLKADVARRYSYTTEARDLLMAVCKEIEILEKLKNDQQSQAKNADKFQM